MKLLLFAIIWVVIALNYSFKSNTDFIALNQWLNAGSKGIANNIQAVIDNQNYCLRQSPSQYNLAYGNKSKLLHEKTEAALQLLDNYQQKIAALSSTDRSATKFMIADGNAEKLQGQLDSILTQMLVLFEDRHVRDVLEKGAPMNYIYSESWQPKHFRGISKDNLVAVLSAIRNDILETELLFQKELKRNFIIPNCYGCQPITAIAFPESRHYLKGDTVSATLGFAAYNHCDPTHFKSSISCNTFIEQGVVTIRFKADKIGEHVVTGTIGQLHDTVVEIRPWRFSYRVASKSAILQPGIGDVVYRFINNPITLKAIDADLNSIELVGSKCDIKKDGNERYTVMVTDPASTTISVKLYERNRHRLHLLQTKTFRVIDLPLPTAFVKEPYNNEIKRDDIEKQLTIELDQPNEDLSFDYRIMSFHVQPILQGDTSEREPIVIKGNRLLFDSTTTALLKQCTKIYLTDISAIGPGNKEVMLNPIVLNIR